MLEELAYTRRPHNAISNYYPALTKGGMPGTIQTRQWYKGAELIP